MTRYTYGRRDSDFPRWKVFQKGEKPMALCETRDQAWQLASDLNELAELRVLLAVKANSLSMSQACEILNLTPEQVQRRIDGCLAKGFK